jgi:hypothetical protein
MTVGSSEKSPPTVPAMIVELLPLSPHAPLRKAPPRLANFRAERRSEAREWERALFARAEFFVARFDSRVGGGPENIRSHHAGA